MDFQLILYIIIVIVWLILDNYRRIKKKQEQTGRRHTTSQQQKEVEKPYTTLEDILREFGMEEEPEVVEHRPVAQEERKARHKPRPKQKSLAKEYETYEGTANYESSISRDYKFSSETFNREYKQSVSSIEGIKKGEIADESVMKKKKAKVDFDLRKAVIWSEILKRPYE